MELPRRGWLLHFERFERLPARVSRREGPFTHDNQGLAVLIVTISALVGLRRRVLYEIHGRKGSSAELALDGVLAHELGELEHDGSVDGARLVVAVLASPGRHRLGEPADLRAALEALAAVIVEARVRGEGRLHVSQDFLPDRFVDGVALRILDDGALGRSCLLRGHRPRRDGRYGFLQERLGYLDRTPGLTKDFPERAAERFEGFVVLFIVTRSAERVYLTRRLSPVV